MSEINLLILDFDGVLTDNKVYVFEDGREAVVCHRGDGWGIRMLQSAGIEVIILSTETNAVVSARAEKLNVTCIQGCEDKASAVQSIIFKHRPGHWRINKCRCHRIDANALRCKFHAQGFGQAFDRVLGGAIECSVG